jgi:hypothetical protein
MRPCNCNRAGKEWHPDDCRLCWLAFNRSAYQILWGIDPATLQPMTPEQLAARTPAEAGDCCGKRAPSVVFSE